MTKWTEKKRKNKIRKDAKFNNVDMIPVMEKLIASGFTETDLGIILGVEKTTIASWKQRYPEIKQANEQGKKLLKGMLLAEMMRAALGYDYVETEIKEGIKLDSDGNELHLKDGEKEATKTTKTRHQKGDHNLMMFIAQNLLPDDFARSPSDVNQNISVLIGSVEEERIRLFAGKLLDKFPRRQIESKDVSDE